MASKNKNSDSAKRRSAFNLKKKHSKKSWSSINDSHYEEPSEIFLPKNKREIFTYFFNAIVFELILSREVVMKTVVPEESSETSLSHYKEKKDGHDNVHIDRMSVGSVCGRRKEMLLHSEPMSTRSSAASTYSTKFAVKVKEKSSVETLSEGHSGRVSIGFAAEVHWIEHIVFKNGNVYDGTCNDYLMDGTGTFTWTDQTVYTGEFTDGYITGEGEMILPNLSKYKGDFCKGIFHGSGFFNPVGTPLCYYGNWKDGKKHGKGLIIYEPGDWYEGDWFTDLRHGIGYRRYKNGAKYKGEWVNDKKQGKGKMMFDNNDYYNGEWFDNMPHGYGEYTWGMLPNEIFCFPVYSWYKGSWKKGERDGVGILNFGTECGSKYAGIFHKNIKHGPGVVICGNGLILESNPIFEYNKPVHKSSQKTYIQLCEENPDLNFMDCTVEKGSYYEILKMINSKTAYSQLNDETLKNITLNSENIPPQMFVKLADSISGNKKIWCPLEIPIHAVPEHVDFSYFFDIIFDYCSKTSHIDDFLTHTAQEEGIKFRRSLGNSRLGSSLQPNLRASTPIIPHTKSRSSIYRTVPIASKEESTEQTLEKAKMHEFELCRNIVLVNRRKLNYVYYKYALLYNEQFEDKETHNDDIVMIRLFLWQLFRDGHVQDGVELAQVDSFMWNNPHSCLDTEHYPFEPIYFYQFLQYLMGCAWLIYLKKLQNKEIQKLSFPSQILRQFLVDFFAKIGPFTGTALRKNLNMAPIMKMYQLYASISEPMSVNTFFAATYNDRLPCYDAISSGIIPPLIDGVNIVPLAHEIYYVKVPDPVSERMKLEQIITNADQFSRSLLTFRTLGKEKITECLKTVCPKVIKHDTKLDMKYNLTFLEFYEIVIMLSFAKAEEVVIGEERKYNNELSRPKSSSLPNSSKIKFKNIKKKKSRKSLIGMISCTSASSRYKVVK